MDSLLASYASSDEEEDTPSSLSLPPPKPPSSSRLFSLPPPKFSLPNPVDDDHDEPESNPPQFPQPKPSPNPPQFPHPKPSPNPTTTTSTRLFSSLPPPKSKSTPNPNPNSVLAPKRVVQFKPPINPNFANPKDHYDSDDDSKARKPTNLGSQSSVGTSSVASFLSSIPPPKNSKPALGALPSSGSARRSILEADVPAPTSEPSNEIKSESQVAQTSPVISGPDGCVAADAAAVSSSYSSTEAGHSNWVPGNQNYDHYGSYGSYGGFESNWANGSSALATMAPESDTLGMIESVVNVPGKRGRNEIPTTIVEVNQDELIKDRPREDQTKLTGIAFGPSFQAVSTKGKPSKLHKRKHQIGSLYFDMKQKETELAERRARGFLTKAETQGKYGW